MSTDAVTEILQILRNHSNISVKVTLTTTKKGFILTNIHLTEPTGIKSNRVSAEKSKIKHKRPSRLLRDSKCNEAYLSKKAGSCEVDPSAAPPSPSTARCTDPTATRRIALVAGNWVREEKRKLSAGSQRWGWVRGQQYLSWTELRTPRMRKKEVMIPTTLSWAMTWTND